MISNVMKRTCQQSLFKKMTDLRKHDVMLTESIGVKRNR